jgi:ribosomal protein S18 acetylase RimI-like enzyme
MLNLAIFPAQASDVESVTVLVNAAYRGESSRQGWTTEADLLTGLRTTRETVLSLLGDKNSQLLLCKQDKALLGCLALLHQHSQVEMSMFAVSPQHQGMGIGKQLLQQAEQTAIRQWSAKQAMMSVISCRHELIAYYERRGYTLTGEQKPFPVNPALWTPLANNLTLSILAKELP